MGNSGSSAVPSVGPEQIFRSRDKDSSTSKSQPSDCQVKRRNDPIYQRGSSCKFTRPKVLPDPVSPLRLRRTDNGDILHNGGTISARRQEFKKGSFEQKTIYGSEPDLRINRKTDGNESFYISDGTNSTKLRISSKCKRKYRAPKTPKRTVGGSSSPDSYEDREMRDEQVSRRMRLFKTRVESQKSSNEDHQRFHQHQLPITTLKRSLSTPQFHDEFINGVEHHNGIRNKENSFDDDIATEWKDRDLLRQDSAERITALLAVPTERLENDQPFDSLLSNHNHDYNLPINNQNQFIRSMRKGPATPVKRFYFGMNDINDTRITDNYRKNLQLNQDNIDGFLSLPGSDTLEVLDDQNDQNNGISVQLRATLPRKQLDIPQFSPLTAWRLLSCGESQQRFDNNGQCEEELEVLSSSAHNNHIHNHNNNHLLLVDKSQDSGISADDSPRIDSQAAWTPQQDLEETSSDGGFSPFQNATNSIDNCQTARFSPRFILSLPRDDRLHIYSDQLKDGEKMRKLKDKLDDRDNIKKDGESALLDSNWVLSRSMPSLLNTTSLRQSQFSSIEVSFEDEELNTCLVKQPSFSYLANGGHIMYLPQYSKNKMCDNNDKNGRTAMGNSAVSKSCEDVTRETCKEITTLQSSASNTSPQQSAVQPKTKSERKFTFQSTIRQLERKRLADKLSKEAETKENERRLEVEAMRKAEEEFQRKREREKVGIRQQLRLFSVSSNPTSTQVLSEFHIPSRDYKDYRNKYGSENDSPKAEVKKKSMVHPAVTYQIPKSTQIYFNPTTNSDKDGESGTKSIGVDNYRKKFAQGGVALADQSNHFTSFDHHIRSNSPIRLKGAIGSCSLQSNRLSETRPTALP